MDTTDSAHPPPSASRTTICCAAPAATWPTRRCRARPMPPSCARRMPAPTSSRSTCKPALAIKGVIAVITAADIKAANVGNLSQHPPMAGRGGAKLVMPVRPALAGDRVRHIGEAVAMVIAETLAAAQDGAEAVEVEYAPLDAVTDLRDAVKPGAPQVWPEAPGNIAIDWAGLAANPDEMAAKVDEAMKSAAHVARISLVHQRINVASMEPRGGTASYDTGERQLPAAGLLAGRPRHARLDGRRDGHSAGQNPRHHRGGRRRVRAQDRPLPRIHRHAGRREEDRPAGASGCRGATNPSSATTTPATPTATSSWRSTTRASSWRCASAISAAWAPISARSAPTSRPPT